MELLISLSIALGLCVGVGAGVWLQRILPEPHRSPESKDIVIVGIGALGMLAGLVLGLLIAATTDDFNKKATDIDHFSSSLIQLDRVLANYGPAAAGARADLKRYAVLKLSTVWPDEGGMTDEAAQKLDAAKSPHALETIGAGIRDLKPSGAVQTGLQSRALDIYSRLSDAQWSMAADNGNSLQTVFLVILVFWLMVMFTGLGVYAPRNATVMLFLFFCAVSFAGAIYVMLEMDGPFSGLITISSGPMHDALNQMGQP